MLNITWTPCLTFELKKVYIQQFLKYCHVIKNNEKALKPASDSTRRPPVLRSRLRRWRQGAERWRMWPFNTFPKSGPLRMFSLQHSDWCFSLLFMWKRRCLRFSLWPGCVLCWWIKNTNVHFNVWFHTNASYCKNIHLEIVLNILILIVDRTSHWSINKLLILRHTSLPCVCSVQGGIAGPQHQAF